MNEPSQDKTVFVIEDDHLVRQTIRTLAESMGLAVEEYDGAEQFLADCDIDRPGCIVADVRLQGMSGVELLERLSEAGSKKPMVIISGYATTPTVVRAMRNGAVTVLDKPFDPNELWQAIREAIREDALGRVKNAQLADLRERFSQLTDQERIVLKLIVAGHINKQISKHLDVSVRTVESRRQQIFKKTGARNLGELMWHAMMLRAEGYGWLSEELEEPSNTAITPDVSSN